MACDIPPIGIDNDPCNAVALGKQPVIIFYQDMAGVPPAIVTAGNTDTRLSLIQAALADTGADQLFLINNLAGGTIGAATDQTISGNDVPRGGTLLTDRDNALTARADYLTPTVSANMDTMNARQAPVRAWWADEKNYIHGPIENARLVFGNLQAPGIGQATSHRAVSMTWTGIPEAPFSATPVPGLAAVTNA